MLTSLHAWRKPLPLPPLKQKNFQAYENNNDDSEHGVAHDAQPALQAEIASVYDGKASALAQGAGLKEQQQVKGHLCLPLHETVVGDRMGKNLAHMLADVAEVEGLEVAEMHGVEQHQYRHHLAVGKTARTVATPLA